MLDTIKDNHVTTEIVAGAIALVLGSYIWERKVRDRISVKHIKSAKDRDVGGLIELYISLFPDDGINYSADDLMAIFQSVSDIKRKRHVRVKDIILAAKYRNSIVGFLFCHYYPDRKKAIISYYGIDKEVTEARKGAAFTLLTKIRSILTHTHNCDFLFFDVERPFERRLKEENAKRKARIVLFKQNAISLGFHAYMLDFDYQQPKITLAKGTHEDSLLLMFVPLKTFHETKLSKDEVVNFLSFVYLDCYGDVYDMDDKRFLKYHQYLIKRVRDYEKSLPSTIHIQ